MERYKSGQYDDDLTVGIDDYDEDIESGDVDLFDYVGDDDSPLSSLKSIILSIDWEITDDNLRQLNEELLELKNTWADDKVKLIYLQALEKISRYIFKEKASAHPSAIKLLLGFYANLEKIVSDTALSDQETKEILREDIERFERLKKKIASSPQKTPITPDPQEISPAVAEEKAEVEELDDVAKESPTQKEIVEEEVLPPSPMPVAKDAERDDTLLNLKAIVYGMDWEITEQDLKNLSSEVKLLEDKYKSSKAKQIFLQGIGSIGAYINLKRSDAHADAFKLLHSFFIGLETVVRDNLTGQEEKDILLPQVDKFNAFKATIAESISSGRADSEDDVSDEYLDTDIQPAFSDMPDDIQGFQEEKEATAMEKSMDGQEANDTIDEYFEEEIDEELSEESDQALASEMESRLDGMFDEPGKEEALNLSADEALKGVDVETDADDDSDEEPLPLEDGELAPALAAEESPTEEEESPAVFGDRVEKSHEDQEATEASVVAGASADAGAEHEVVADSTEITETKKDIEIAASSADELDDSDIDKTASIAKEDIDSKLDDFFADSPMDDETDNVIDEAAVSTEPDEIKEESLESKEESSESDAEGIDENLTDFFGDEQTEISTETDEKALQGVDVETIDDDDSNEMPLPEEDGELAPAFAEVQPVSEEEETVSFLSEDKETREDEEDVEEAIVGEDIAVSDSDFEEDVAEEEQAVSAESSEMLDKMFTDDTDDTDELTTTDVLRGVDVETEEDDDSEEEPLPFEDGELAPALAADEDGTLAFDYDDEEVSDEVSEEAVEERFEALFGDNDEISKEDDALSGALDDLAESDEEIAIDDTFEFQEPESVVDFEEEVEFESVQDVEEEVEFESVQDVEEEVEFESVADVDEVFQALSFEEAGFEEIIDDEIEEIPEGILADSDVDSLDSDQSDSLLLDELSEDAIEEIDDDILTLLGDDDSAKSLLGDTDKISDEFVAVPDETLLPTDSEDDHSAFLKVSEDDGGGTLPEGPDHFSIEDAGFDEIEDQDEVIFEPVEDDALIDEIDASKDNEFFGDFDESDSFGTTLLSTDDVPGSEEGLEDISEDAPASLSLDEDFEDFDEFPETEEVVDEAAYISSETESIVSDDLVNLRNCIASVGLELDDTIINGLNEEIEKLRHLWLDRPIEKTFIQLISTVTGHIDRYRYAADSQANKLLLSIFEKLELCALGQSESGQIQEAILNETSKVLHWQSDLIDRTAIAGDTQIVDKSDLSVFGEEKQGEDEESVIFESVPSSPMSGEATEETQLIENVSAVMKSELEQLKQTFQTEIKELKDEIRQVQKKED